MRDEVGGWELRLCVPDVHNARILDAQLRLHLVQQLTANTLMSCIECQRRLRVRLYWCESQNAQCKQGFNHSSACSHVMAGTRFLLYRRRCRHKNVLEPVHDHNYSDIVVLQC